LSCVAMSYKGMSALSDSQDNEGVSSLTKTEGRAKRLRFGRTAIARLLMIVSAVSA